MRTRTTQIYLSKCCLAPAVEDFKDNPRDHHDPIEIYSCSSCKRECEIEDDAVCELCLGRGKVRSIGTVYAGEPHTADVDMTKCECQIDEGEESDNQD